MLNHYRRVSDCWYYTVFYYGAGWNDDKDKLFVNEITDSNDLRRSLRQSNIFDITKDDGKWNDVSGHASQAMAVLVPKKRRMWMIRL